MTNAERVERAQAALDTYIAHTGDRPDESHFRDLLCDMMHLARATGRDFADDLRIAQSAHECEIEDEEG